MNFLDNIQKYWKLISVSATGLVVAITYIVSLEPRIPDTAEEMIEIRNAVDNMPTKESRAIDSMNDAHAIEIRQMRYEDRKKDDSLRTIYEHRKDSITLDYIKRQTVQIEQLEEKIDEVIKNNN